MSVMPTLWIIWASLAAILLLLLLYRSTLTRYEEDQLFLDDSFDRQRGENDAVLRKVAKIKPLVKIISGATGAMTAAILGMYVWDAIRAFNL